MCMVINLVSKDFSSLVNSVSLFSRCCRLNFEKCSVFKRELSVSLEYLWSEHHSIVKIFHHDLRIMIMKFHQFLSVIHCLKFWNKTTRKKNKKIDILNNFLIIQDAKMTLVLSSKLWIKLKMKTCNKSSYFFYFITKWRYFISPLVN
jgi:hypothetical protein